MNKYNESELCRETDVFDDLKGESRNNATNIS